MQEDIEFALANCLDWRKFYNKYIDTEKFETDIFVKAFFAEEYISHFHGGKLDVDVNKIWSRTRFERSSFQPWPYSLDRERPEFGIFSVVGKYKPMNRRTLNRVLHGKERPPIRLSLRAVGLKKSTRKGSMYYYLTENSCLVITGHAAMRMTERSDLPDTKDIAPLSALFDIFRTMTPVEDEGVIGTTPMGAFLGYRHRLEKPVGTFPAGFTVTLCKTYLPYSMLRPEQKKKCTEASFKKLAEVFGDDSTTILEVIKEQIGDEKFDMIFGDAPERLTSSSAQGTLKETQEETSCEHSNLPQN